MAESQEMVAEGSVAVEGDQSPERMSDGDYLATQVVLGNLAGFVIPLDLDGFLQRIGEAEAAGPVLDPSLYKEAARDMDRIRRLAQAARDFQKVAKEVHGEIDSGEGE